MLGSLNPAVAQILGLYWLDATAVSGVTYDYLLLADHDNTLGGTAASALTWLSAVADFTVVDGCACFSVVAQPAPPVVPPADVRVYALPGTTIAPDSGGAVIDGTNNAGLTWDRQQNGTILATGAPLMYHVWRAALGDADAPATPADSDFTPLTADAPLPVGYSIMADPQIPDQPDDWPPFSMNYIDRALAEGWYGYRVSSVDLFGRHSAHSPSAPWYQWAPAPVPPPWYYADPPADRAIDLASIQLLDKTPPPPTGVEAFALDPADPSVLKDPAWQAWQATLSPAEQASVVGLRVRWWWTQANQRQAPDTREFRIYFQQAPVNTMRGRVTSVSAASATQSLIVTDIANTQPAGAFSGASVRIGATSFAVIGSEASTPLTLTVSNVGPTVAITPATGSRCALVLPDGSPLRQDFRIPAAWQERVHVVGIGESSVADGIGNRYEVLLPVPADTVRTGLPLATTLAEPVAMAVIGVTAVDDKPHTPDSRGDPARFGNESMVGGPATVLRVLRTPPPAPDVLPDAEKVFASPADYHDQSYFTYRWLPPTAGLKTLVYRALDDGVFQADLAKRPRAPLTGTEPGVFPLTDPAWTPARCQHTATELNALNALHPSNPPTSAGLLAAAAAYRALSNDALRVLAGLSGTEKVFIQLSTQPLDPADPQWLTVGPDLPAGSLPAGQRAYVDTLDGRAGNRYFYRSAHIDEVHNVGPLGLSSPPVWLPNVTPPRAPAIASITGGERQVAITWSSNREPGLAEYHVYRTDDMDASRDIRLMDLVHVEPVAAGDPATRPAAVSWTDNPVPGLVDLWYRVVAVDLVAADPRGGGGNVSAPSPATRTRAFDLAPPDPPPFTTVEWVRVDDSGTVHVWTDTVPAGAFWPPAVRLAWTPAPPDVRLLVQVMAASDESFGVASPWLAPGTSTFLHRTTATFEAHQYRLTVVNGAGNTNNVYQPSTLPQPA
jgi:hypothetical protein